MKRIWAWMIWIKMLEQANGREGSSQGYAPWQHDRSQDDLLLATQEAQQRDPQGESDKPINKSEKLENLTLNKKKSQRKQMKKQKKAKKKEHDIKNNLYSIQKKNYFFFYKIPSILKSINDKEKNSI
ncbi:hypothetical protein DOY81_012777 [Sarcophaga bullata]|nr:hypothetical protein DOY81_012777 [Sarcophaga bullata]